jgi:hypothetical protein
MEASKRANFVRKIHVKTKEAIDNKGKYTADHANKKRKEVLFQPDDWFGYTFARIYFHSYVSPSCCHVVLVLKRFFPRLMIIPKR